MGLKYNASGRTYDLGGPQYTNVGGGSKRLNYIASGKTHQLGLATDKTCSQYSPLVMKVNGTNYYIGRSQSGSYIASDSISSTRLNTRTSSGYSTQSHTYIASTYTIICITSEIDWYNNTYSHSDSITDTIPGYGLLTSSTMRNWTYHDWGYNEDRNSYVYSYATFKTYNADVNQQTLTSTKNVYYTTNITNTANITVSTTKSASSSSHNFV